MKKTRKEYAAAVVAKVKTLKMINKKYPSNQWINVFCKTQQKKEQAQEYPVTYSLCKGLGPCITNFDGKMEAIKIATQKLLYRPNIFTKGVILSDSRAAIGSIVNIEETNTYQIRQIRKIFKN